MKPSEIAVRCSTLLPSFQRCEKTTGVLGKLSKYIRETQTEAMIGKAGIAGNLRSEAEVRLYRALLSVGPNISPKVVVGGYQCDFVIKGNNSVINLVCDGRIHTD